MNKTSHTALHTRLQEYIQYSELKNLAYTLATLQGEKGFHSLAVLSIYPAEGKTLFCAALAMAYAETCRARVLVMDTTTYVNKDSLALKECFNGSAQAVHVLSLAELRQGERVIEQPQLSARGEKIRALEGEVVHTRPAISAMQKENDFSLLKRSAEDSARQYGLVLLDTASVEAKNRSNIDPLLVARISDASVLVASHKLLESPHISRFMKMLEDPALHLSGIISNEGL